MLNGKGVFETMRAYHGGIYLANEHIERLTKGLRTLRIKCPLTKQKLMGVLIKSLKKNKLKNAKVRLTAWKDKGGLHLSVIVDRASRISAAKFKKGFRLEIHNGRLNEKASDVSLKSINYGFYMTAFQWAKKKGFDEALLINRKGEVAEGSRTNIFLVKDGGILTPHLRSGCLNGITRQKVLKIAKSLSIPCRERSLILEDFFEAQEVFITNSSIEIVPVSSIGRQKIGNGIRPITNKIHKKYRKAISSRF